MRFLLLICFFTSSNVLAGVTTPPEPIFPSQQQTLNSSPQRYTWRKIISTTRYDFYLYDRKKQTLIFRDQNIPQCLAEQCSYKIPNSIKLLEGENHVWRVRAITDNGTTNFSYTSFNIKEKLSIPTTISPQKNAKIPFLNKPISFSWEKDDKATHYDFYIYDRNLRKAVYRNRFISPNCDFQNICIFTPPNNIIISKGEEHVWRIRSVNNYGSSEWSYSLFDVKNNASNTELQHYLSSPLWNKENAYDAGHFAMLPLHSSFTLSQYSNLRTLFRSQFSSFLSLNGKVELESLGNLAAYQYYYLMSQFLVLSEKYGSFEDRIENNRIKKLLCNKITSYWLDDPAWQYGAPPFDNMKKRTEWKLNVSEQSIAYPYHRGIFDEELFFFAIAHDLHQVVSYESCSTTDEIIDATYQVINQRSELTIEGGWLFDSVWGEHPYNKYAGYLDKSTVTTSQPLIIPSLPWDSSHFHRFPLWLKSFKEAYPVGSDRYNYYQSIIEKLAIQFKTKVMTRSDSNWFYTNYMDGWNGVFRYSVVNEKPQGYDPFELSATPLLGWWYFLNDKDINSIYCLISNNFPLSNETLKTYVGLNSSRKRNPIVRLPDSLFQGAILQTIPQQACHMSKLYGQ